MTDTLKAIGLVIAGTVIGWLVSGQANFGGVYSNITKDFSQGISVDGTVVIDGSGNVDAPVTSTTGTFSSTLDVTGDLTAGTTDLFVDVSANAVGFGTSTPLALVHVEDQSATSTLIVSTKAASKGGRIILEDHDGAGCSEIAILNGTVAAKTVPCPTGI